MDASSQRGEQLSREVLDHPEPLPAINNSSKKAQLMGQAKNLHTVQTGERFPRQKLFSGLLLHAWSVRGGSARSREQRWPKGWCFCSGSALRKMAFWVSITT